MVGISLAIIFSTYLIKKLLALILLESMIYMIVWYNNILYVAYLEMKKKISVHNVTSGRDRICFCDGPKKTQKKQKPKKKEKSHYFIIIILRLFSKHAGVSWFLADG